MSEKLRYQTMLGDYRYLQNVHGCEPSNDAEDFERLLHLPNYQTGRAVMRSQILKWLNDGPINWNDPNLGAISKRYDFVKGL